MACDASASSANANSQLEAAFDLAQQAKQKAKQGDNEAAVTMYREAIQAFEIAMPLLTDLRSKALIQNYCLEFERTVEGLMHTRSIVDNETTTTVAGDMGSTSSTVAEDDNGRVTSSCDDNSGATISSAAETFRESADDDHECIIEDNETCNIDNEMSINNAELRTEGVANTELSFAVIIEPAGVDDGSGTATFFPTDDPTLPESPPDNEEQKGIENDGEEDQTATVTLHTCPSSPPSIIPPSRVATAEVTPILPQHTHTHTRTCTPYITYTAHTHHNTS